MSVIMMFFVYGFVGWNIEVIYYMFKEKRFVNRGFLNGPIVPIYGLAMIAMHLLVHEFMLYTVSIDVESILLIFVLITFFSTMLELIGGYILLKAFETRWWDYSHLKFNLNGFICLRFSLVWGIMGTLGYVFLHELYVYPWLEDFDGVFAVVLTNTFLIVFFIDWMFTIVALLNFKQMLRELRSRALNLRNKSDILIQKDHSQLSQSLRARLNGIIENTKNNETLSKVKAKIDSLRDFFTHPKDKDVTNEFEMLKKLSHKITSSRFYKAFPEIKLVLRKDEMRDEYDKKDSEDKES